MVGPQKITTKGFFAGSVLVGSKVLQKKSIPKSDPGNMPNLHNFKMATPKISMYNKLFSGSL